MRWGETIGLERDLLLPQERARSLPRRRAARRRRAANLLAAGQGRAVAARPAARPQEWMIEDGIPEILAGQRLGHQVPGMRGLYAHASQQVREELTAALQARWDESLRRRAAIDPHSPDPLLDNLLAPFRAAPAGHPRSGATIGGLSRWLRSQQSYLAPAPENACSQGFGRRCAP